MIDSGGQQRDSVIHTHVSILPWTEEPSRLQSMELQRVGHGWAANTSTFSLVSPMGRNQLVLVLKKLPDNAGGIRDVGSVTRLGRSTVEGMSTPVFLPGEAHRQRSLVVYSLWGCKSWTPLERLCMHAFSPKLPSHPGGLITLRRFPCAI